MKNIAHYSDKNGNPCDCIDDAYCVYFTTEDENGKIINYSPFSCVGDKPLVLPKDGISKSTKEETEEILSKMSQEERDFFISHLGKP